MIFKPHTTVAVIVESEQRLLFIEERVGGELVINQPSGHLEAGESLIDAARREALEETGCRIEPQAVVGIYQWRELRTGKAFLRFTFSATLLEEQAHAELDEGIERTRWLTPAEFQQQPLAHRSPVIERSLEDYLSGDLQPLSLLHWLEP
ncbi:MAG: NUDIX hydrolase [Pseudomonadota bacterium]